MRNIALQMGLSRWHAGAEGAQNIRDPPSSKKRNISASVAAKWRGYIRGITVNQRSEKNGRGVFGLPSRFGAYRISLSPPGA